MSGTLYDGNIDAQASKCSRILACKKAQHMIDESVRSPSDIITLMILSNFSMRAPFRLLISESLSIGVLN